MVMMRQRFVCAKKLLRGKAYAIVSKVVKNRSVTRRETARKENANVRYLDEIIPPPPARVGCVKRR